MRIAHAGSSELQRELVSTRTFLTTHYFSKDYYERISEKVLKDIPPESKEILSVGAGIGSSEIELQRQGHRVTVIPLDSIISVDMKEAGITVLKPDLESALSFLSGKHFDFLIMNNILQYYSKPAGVLKKILSYLEAQTVYIVLQNTRYFKIRKLAYLKQGNFYDLRYIKNFEKSGYSSVSTKEIIASVKEKEYSAIKIIRNYKPSCRLMSVITLNILPDLFSNNIIIRAKKRYF
jgi:2-polyprenyl-3-methyl-5-hydroxy-6-metoxy-1,4-benzoquinol methylase